jgi:hypothetical integral membrane protein (TIGR02206 family)
MNPFFTYQFTGAPFVLFSAPHLAALGLIALLNIFFVLGRNSFSISTRKIIRYTMAAVLILNEIGWHIWNASVGRWTIQEMLPFHLCSILVWTGAYMLVKKDVGVYEFAYLLGIPGALQAILTPDLGIFGFPHYRYFQTFISHGLIITSAVYMTVVEGFRPYPKSIRNILVWGNAYMLVVSLINWAIGSNYLFTAHKPLTASVLDVLPAWPWYIIFIELMAFVFVFLLYIPFLIKDLSTKRAPANQLL